MHHGQIIAATFVTVRFEEEENLPSTLDSTGVVQETANPFAKRLRDDVMMYHGISGTEAVFELWNLSGLSRVKLFKDEEVKQAFVILDPSCLRVAYWMDLLPASVVPDEDEEEEFDIFTCELLDKHGEPCGSTFKSAQSLSAQQSRMRGGQHGMVRVLREAVLTNQCPWCRSTLASRETAQAHVVRAWKYKRCRADLSGIKWEARQPPTLSCPLTSAALGSIAGAHCGRAPPQVGHPILALQHPWWRP
jgi:hypothetical protein